MLPERYRRLWRRRLRRRPLLPFLLAATLAVMLVAPFSNVTNPAPGDPTLAAVGAAMAVIAVSGIWLTSRLSYFLARAAVSGLLVLMFGLSLPLDGDPQATATFGVVVVAINAILGGVLRVPQRLRAKGLRNERRTFSIAAILVLTAATATAIVGFQNLDLDVLLALTTDPVTTGYMLVEAFAAPTVLLVSLLIRSPLVSASVIAIATVGGLVICDLTLSNDQVPAIWLPPHYYHVGLVGMTTAWILGTRSVPREPRG